MVGVAVIVATFALTNHVAHNNAYTALSPTPVSATYVAPTPTPAVTRTLTADEQAFIDQACRDAANQSIFNTCKQAFIDSWDK